MNIKRHYRPEKVKKYEARWYVEGRLKYRFFATENERERFIEEFQEQLSQNGLKPKHSMMWIPAYLQYLEAMEREPAYR